MGFLIVDNPQAVFDAQMISGDQGRAIPHRVLDHALHFFIRVGIEPEHRAEIEASRMIEGQPIRLGAGERLLVRINLPLADWLEPNPGEETLARVALSFDVERLVIHVKRDVIVLPQGARAQPLLSKRAAR